ncbi:hypothetical protein WH47_05167 [Habropoda laboriosa]|uniref:Uncharacterized protein n=1 Tax=Habropoda laboriosa TaxID=597456 RepID=A0A0L7QSD5_9HYME|nr:hypothetical protein WH47_05167 [Habropoda laboriosa]
MVGAKDTSRNWFVATNPAKSENYELITAFVIDHIHQTLWHETASLLYGKGLKNKDTVLEGSLSGEDDGLLDCENLRRTWPRTLEQTYASNRQIWYVGEGVVVGVFQVEMMIGGGWQIFTFRIVGADGRGDELASGVDNKVVKWVDLGVQDLGRVGFSRWLKNVKMNYGSVPDSENRYCPSLAYLVTAMSDPWNITAVEVLDDKNYFLWSEKVEGILGSKKLWKKVIGVKQIEKPLEGDAEYEEKLKDGQKNADKLWTKIKLDMAAESEELKARSLNELTNLKMKKNETVDVFLNRAEALANQCIRLGRNMEEFELIITCYTTTEWTLLFPK